MVARTFTYEISTTNGLRERELAVNLQARDHARVQLLHRRWLVF